MKRPIVRLGTRTSRLARWQTDYVVAQLHAAWPDLHCEVIPFTTKGDEIIDRPLPEIGGKGLFTAELERALHDNVIDVAVHSLKDLPVDDSPGLTIGAIPQRAPVQDALISGGGLALREIPQGTVVGTSSNRRRAQLLSVRPDLKIRSIRGNIETRLRKVIDTQQYGATILALAGLERLALTHHVTEVLSLRAMLPAPGQGALGVQCRAGDRVTLDWLAAIEVEDARIAVQAERTFLQALGGGCSAPIGAYARIESTGRIEIRGVVASTDGQSLIPLQASGTDPIEVGSGLAARARQLGAAELLV